MPYAMKCMGLGCLLFGILGVYLITENKEPHLKSVEEKKLMSS